MAKKKEQGILLPGGIRLEISSEDVLNDQKAKVSIYKDGNRIATVVGGIVKQQGADQGMYPAVELKLL